MRKSLLFCVFVANFTSAIARADQPVYCLHATEDRWYACDRTQSNLGPADEDGRPWYVTDENLYYAYNNATGKFIPVAKWAEKSDRFYQRYDFRTQRWMWVTGGDRRAVVAGSKVQGWRLGVTMADDRGLNWFRLQPEEGMWHKVTDRERPEIYRREPDGRVVLGERYPEDWTKLGGKVDPLPTDKPKCTLKVNPPETKVRQPIQLHLSVEGTVTSAFLDDQKILVLSEGTRQFADIPRLPQTPGFVTATVRIAGPGGEATCEAYYTVLPEG